jgi:hemimethylated DNA binding protein
MSPSVARALYRAIKRKQAHMASDVEHLLMPKYVSTICHQLSPKVQDLFIATSIAIAKARSPQNLCFESAMKGKDRWCPFERDALAQLGLTDEAPRPSADEPVQSATLAQEVQATAAFDEHLQYAFRNEPPSQSLVGFEALKVLDWMHDRLRLARGNAESAQPLDEVPFELEVGDVVVHKEHGHVGVVAERFAVSMMPDAWFQQHLGGLDSPMLQSPWYLVLVDDRCLGQQKRLVRYGSELTHARHDKCTGGKILHGRLQYYFRGYNHETRRFIPQHKPNSLEPFMMQLVEDVGLPEQRVQKLFGGMP